MREMASSEFKTHCLAVIDEVAATGSPVLIRKRGRAVAQLIRYIDTEEEFPQFALRGSATIVSEIESPVVPAGEWNEA